MVDARDLVPSAAYSRRRLRKSQDTAIGSEVSFQTEVAADGRTVCSMWLSSSGRAGVGGLLGATSDARFIRPYMQQVGKELRAVDPQIQVTTG